MKKIFSVILISMFSIAHSQENTSSNKNIFGIQASFLGVNIYSESQLSEQFVLRSEVELTAGIWGGGFYSTSKIGFALVPVLSIIPKWYYNINKRNNTNKNTNNNSSNYISAKLSFFPDWFVISNVNGIGINPMISLIPTWD